MEKEITITIDLTDDNITLDGKNIRERCYRHYQGAFKSCKDSKYFT